MIREVAKDPAFLFYSSDFLSGTMLMTNEQVGKYIRLLCLQHQKGKLAEREIMKMCGPDDDDILTKFIKDDDGKYYNVRLFEESVKRKEYSESRRANRAKGDYSKVYVYIIKNTANGQCKIGSSNNPKRRLIELSNKTNDKLEILFYFGHVEQKVETALHKKYSAKNVINEWFELNDTDLTEIKDMYAHMIVDMTNHKSEHIMPDMENENENTFKIIIKDEQVFLNDKNVALGLFNDSECKAIYYSKTYERARELACQANSLVPETLLHWVDAFNRKIGLNPQKRMFNEWINYFNNWLPKHVGKNPEEIHRPKKPTNGAKIDRYKHPDFPEGFPYSQNNIYRYENKLPLQTIEQEKAWK